jgi:hypothetical protein
MGGNLFDKYFPEDIFHLISSNVDLGDEDDEAPPTMCDFFNCGDSHAWDNMAAKDYFMRGDGDSVMCSGGAFGEGR